MKIRMKKRSKTSSDFLAKSKNTIPGTLFKATKRREKTAKGVLKPVYRHGLRGLLDSPRGIPEEEEESDESEDGAISEESEDSEMGETNPAGPNGLATIKETADQGNSSKNTTSNKFSTDFEGLNNSVTVWSSKEGAENTNTKTSDFHKTNGTSETAAGDTAANMEKTGDAINNTAESPGTTTTGQNNLWNLMSHNSTNTDSVDGSPYDIDWYKPENPSVDDFEVDETLKPSVVFSEDTVGDSVDNFNSSLSPGHARGKRYKGGKNINKELAIGKNGQNASRIRIHAKFNSSYTNGKNDSKSNTSSKFFGGSENHHHSTSSVLEQYCSKKEKKSKKNQLASREKSRQDSASQPIVDFTRGYDGSRTQSVFRARDGSPSGRAARDGLSPRAQSRAALSQGSQGGHQEPLLVENPESTVRYSHVLSDNQKSSAKQRASSKEKSDSKEFSTDFSEKSARVLVKEGKLPSPRPVKILNSSSNNTSTEPKQAAPWNDVSQRNEWVPYNMPGSMRVSGTKHGHQVRIRTEAMSKDELSQLAVETSGTLQKSERETSVLLAQQNSINGEKKKSKKSKKSDSKKGDSGKGEKSTSSKKASTSTTKAVHAPSSVTTKPAQKEHLPPEVEAANKLSSKPTWEMSTDDLVTVSEGLLAKRKRKQMREP